MASRHMIPTVVISGFPAVGKSFLCTKFPTLGRDLESSDYHWKRKNGSQEFELSKKGNKIPNPSWPNNYIETIDILSKSGMYRSVFVSSHQLIRTKMAEAGIKYTNLVPEDSPKMKEIILDRMKKRGSPDTFIEDIEKNYSKYVKSMIKDKGATATLVLTPETIQEWSKFVFML